MFGADALSDAGPALVTRLEGYEKRNRCCHFAAAHFLLSIPAVEPLLNAIVSQR
jgi:hypothetical protein